MQTLQLWAILVKCGQLILIIILNQEKPDFFPEGSAEAALNYCRDPQTQMGTSGVPLAIILLDIQYVLQYVC